MSKCRVEVTGELVSASWDDNAKRWEFRRKSDHVSAEFTDEEFEELFDVVKRMRTLRETLGGKTPAYVSRGGA